MKVVKNINNNVSLCLDSQGREVIVFGKGIGFTKPPYEVGLDKIQRTFYDVNDAYLSVIAEIPGNILETATKIYDYAIQQFNNQYSSNVIFTLADHIQFAVKREKEHINIKLPLMYEVRRLYPMEVEIGEFARKLIAAELHINLPEEEAASIALHFVDYENSGKKVNTTKVKSDVEKVTEYIEKTLNIQIDKTGFNYSRFVTHLHYLLERVDEKWNISSDNRILYEMLTKQYPEISKCAAGIKDLLKIDFNDEEQMYLIIHINRLCTREDCYQ